MRSIDRRKLYNLVKKIPRGSVATYGALARTLGHSKAARAVGTLLHQNPDRQTIPCHRVVNCAGNLATRFAFGGYRAQKRMLEREGVIVIGNRVIASQVRREVR